MIRIGWENKAVEPLYYTGQAWVEFEGAWVMVHETLDNGEVRVTAFPEGRVRSVQYGSGVHVEDRDGGV